MSQTQPPTRRTSPILLIIILVMLVLSATAIGEALAQLVGGQAFSVALNFLILGAVGIALSTYLLSQTRRRVKLAPQIQRILAAVTCPKCGFKTVRDFQRGDFILKDAESCPKCSEKMTVSSIYREVDEKDKEKKEAKF
jgi:hypothetical protein